MSVKGNLDRKVTLHAVLDEAPGTVSYAVDVEPSPGPRRLRFANLGLT